jgi:predicted nucleic acid-binding protein
VEPPILDTNVLLRHFLGDHPDQSPRATAYISQIERGERRVRTADTVVFETVFVLERTFHHPKAMIRDGVLGVLNLPGIVLPGKRRVRQAFMLYVELNLPFADAYHAVLAMELGAGEIVSFDRDFDRIPDVRRAEP